MLVCVCLRWCLDGISLTFFTPPIDQPVKTLSHLSQPAHICEEIYTSMHMSGDWTPIFSASVLLPSSRPNESLIKTVSCYHLLSGPLAHEQVRIRQNQHGFLTEQGDILEDIRS